MKLPKQTLLPWYAPFLLCLLASCGDGPIARMGDGTSGAPPVTQPGGTLARGGTGSQTGPGYDPSTNNGSGSTGSSDASGRAPQSGTGSVASPSGTGSNGGANGRNGSSGNGSNVSGSGANGSSGANGTGSPGAGSPSASGSSAGGTSTGNAPGTPGGTGTNGPDGVAPETNGTHETNSNDPDAGKPPAVRLLSSAECPLRYEDKPAPAALTGADPLAHLQWYLNNDGSQAGTVAGEDLHLGTLHSRYRGEDVRIAVVDDGIEMTHEDLRQNMVPNGSYNYLAELPDWPVGSPWAVPCTKDQDHGTAVAGIIAARDDNGVGIRGVAPRAQLRSFNAISGGTDLDILDALQRHVEDTDIYSNSWGGGDDTGQYQDALPSRVALSGVINAGLKKGRNGLGSIYVFSAGNGHSLGDYSAYDGNVTLYGVMAACSTHAAGLRAHYSEMGPNLLVCAPAGSAGDEEERKTLPLVETTHLNDTYTARFSDTSAAAPMVSGVVALMLQANPKLTWRDVPLVLAQSARKVDAQSAGWTQYGPWHYHHAYGFGVADATAAVALARTWPSVGGSDAVKRCGTVTHEVGRSIPKSTPLTDYDALDDFAEKLDYNAPVADGMTDSITLPDDGSCPAGTVEHVEVTLEITDAGGKAEHPDSGKLHIALTSPSGRTSTLILPHPCYEYTPLGESVLGTCEGLTKFSIGITRHMGEPFFTGNNRNWTLSLADHSASAGGQLRRWSILLSGH